MTGQRTGVRASPHSRNAGSEPPGFDRVAGAFHRSGRWYLALGIATALSGLAFLGGSLLDIAGGAARETFLLAGGFVILLSVFLFLQAARRQSRVAFLGRLKARWAMLARAGDPDDQIATLRRAYDGLIANDLRVRVTSPR
jgi:hypothetical protein